MNKHAYMIIAHNQFDILEIIIKMLDDARNDIYLHIDSKVKNFDFDRFANIPRYSKLVFTDRISVTWGDFSQINCEMILLNTAVSNEDKNNRYSYYHLISGVDLPIKSNDDIYSFFENNSGKEFINFSNEPAEKFLGRIKYYHFFRKKRNKFNILLAGIVLRIQKLIGVNRIKNTSLIFGKGSNWFSITGDFAKYVVENFDTYKKYFLYSYCCDEMFLHTMFLNSPFKNSLYLVDDDDNQLAAARLIDWKRGRPYVFRLNDFDEIINSPAMFARKFSSDEIEIVHKIKDYIER